MAGGISIIAFMGSGVTSQRNSLADQMPSTDPHVVVIGGIQSLLLLVVLISCGIFGHLSHIRADEELSPRVLVVLLEPSALRQRLDSIIAQIAVSALGYSGTGGSPRSVLEAAELVEHSTHTTSFPMSGRVSMRSGLSSAILRSLSHQGSSPAGML